jgi:large subunit ribosomal protein L21
MDPRILFCMFAVIKTGGKQYIVSPGQKIKIEKLPNKEGEEVVFDQVLLQETDKDTKIGTPLVQGAQMKGKVLRQGMGKKTIAYKYKAKKREHSKKGHRQLFTEVEIIEA